MHAVGITYIPFCRAYQELSPSYPHLVTHTLTRAPELLNAEFEENIARKRIEANSALSKRSFDKRFKILRQLATMLRTFFSKSVFKSDISSFKVDQKTQNWMGKFFFCLTCVSFVEKKILRILAGTARIVVAWFSQYSCF
jgi:hypothetical protein